MRRAKAREYARQVDVRVGVCARQVCVEVRRFDVQRLQDEVVGGRLDTWVVGVETEGKGAVQDISQGDERGGRAGEVEEQQSGDGLRYTLVSV